MDAYAIPLYHVVLITGLFLTGLLLFYLASVAWHRRRHAVLQRKQFLYEVTLLEKERTRVACDLHDELAPLLSLAKFQIDNAPGVDPHLLEKASQHLTTVMLRLGEIAANLNAHKLVKKGLAFALQDYLLEVEGVATLKVSFTYAVVHEVPATISIHLYRIAQEIVQNVIKHSAATELHLHVKERFGKLYVLFTDNGNGFAFEDALQKAKGIGLQSIRNRTGMLGGTYRCTSATGRGTQYFFEFPFQPSAYDQRDFS